MNATPPYVPVALSIRQPWAWLIVNGHKDVENRSWWCGRRGPIFIHAGKTMTKDDYAACMIFIAAIAGQLSGKWRVPEYHVLQQQCGGIVGHAEIVDCVTHSNSPWFVGKFGIVLKNQMALPLARCKGKLGFFQVELDPTYPLPHLPTPSPGVDFLGKSTRES